MEPLASKIRPKNLGEFIGQKHLVGEGKPLRVAIEKKHLFSFVLWGPPGCGKTTLAKIYARSLGGELFELSAVSAGKDDVREIVKFGGLRQKILFLDEIHRFNKAQQDYLLPYVESGEIVLIGATTENPSFEVISPLLSRCRVFVLDPLSDGEVGEIIDRAYAILQEKDARPVRGRPAKGTATAASGRPVSNGAREWLINMANGDARQALAVLETARELYGTITLEALTNALQSKFLRYDKKGDEHYNIISAFIKSMRASQPDAALYYLARMIESGEDPKFIARRMVIFASEDIGMARPTALVVANEVFRAVEIIGMPEAQINLAHGTVYLATAKKDRSAYDAYFRALDDVKKYGNLPVPLNIRNAPTKLMKNLGYGKGYEKYSKESYLPEKLKGKKYLK